MERDMRPTRRRKTRGCAEVFREVADAVQEPILLLDAKGTVLYANAAVAKALD